MTRSRLASGIRVLLLVTVLGLSLAAELVDGGRQGYAHADLESSTPAEDEVLSESPPEIEMIFGQELARQGGFPAVTIVNEAGDVLADEPVLDETDRTRLTIALPPALATGRYTVIWHTLSDDDGEEAQGAFHFFVGDGVSGATPTDDPGSPPPTGTTVVTQPPASADDGGDGVPWWALVGGVAVALVIGTSAGVTLANRRGQ